MLDVDQRVEASLPSGEWVSAVTVAARLGLNRWMAAKALMRLRRLGVVESQMEEYLASKGRVRKRNIYRVKRIAWSAYPDWMMPKAYVKSTDKEL